MKQKNLPLKQGSESEPSVQFKTETSEETRTTAQTVAKGSRRIAHTPSTVSCFILFYICEEHCWI